MDDSSAINGTKSERGENDRAESKLAPRQPEADEQTSGKNASKSDDKGKDAPEDKRGFFHKVRDWIGAHRVATILIIVGIIVAIAAGILWWLHARQFESTDDAFIDTRVTPISSQVAGVVTQLDVSDNQSVEAGAELFKIDDRDYRAALDQATAEVDQGAANAENVVAQQEAQQASIDQANTQVTQAQAALDYAKQENTRFQQLVATGAGTRERAEQANSDLRQKQASLDAAQASLVGAQKQAAVLRSQEKVSAAQIEQAKARLETAKTNLDRTRVMAPVAGRATKIGAARGSYAQPGQALMMFVPRDIWITANFKETQLTLMRPGQPVDIRIDAYPGRPFHGHVDSIQAGSGAAFSLLPAENATGNYVKVVQRVPVKIVFDEAPDVYLGPGMSVVPTVRVR